MRMMAALRILRLFGELVVRYVPTKCSTHMNGSGSVGAVWGCDRVRGQ